MAKFVAELPDAIMKDFETIYGSTEKIFGEMTKAGALVAYNNIIANVPEGIRNSGIMDTLMISRVYRTPSDDGINTKVLFNGYFTNENGVRTPAPLVVNVFEYGRSGGNFPKQPFFRKSFRKAQIEKAMLEAQKQASGGLLDE